MTDKDVLDYLKTFAEILEHQCRYLEIDDVETDENNWLDYRLRLHDDNLYLHIGLADYDTDHRGFIAAGCVSAEYNLQDYLNSLKESYNEIKMYVAMAAS